MVTFQERSNNIIWLTSQHVHSFNYSSLNVFFLHETLLSIRLKRENTWENHSTTDWLIDFFLNNWFSNKFLSKLAKNWSVGRVTESQMFLAFMSWLLLFSGRKLIYIVYVLSSLLRLDKGLFKKSTLCNHYQDLSTGYAITIKIEDYYRLFVSITLHTCYTCNQLICFWIIFLHDCVYCSIISLILVRITNTTKIWMVNAYALITRLQRQEMYWR